jgi:hypothetical protein
MRIAAIITALAVLAFVPAAASTASRLPPGVRLTSAELRLSKPVTSLAADGGRAAFVVCTQLLGVWRPGAAGVVHLGPPKLWTCPPPVSAESIQSLAVANDRIAWSSDEGGNTVDNRIFVTTLAHPHTLTGVAQIEHCCRGQADQERMGYVFGDANFIVFGSRYKCGDIGPPACSSGAPSGFVEHSVWRIGRPPFTSTCVYKPGPCQQLATGTSPLEPLSVDSGRVALRREDGAVIVRTLTGLLIRRFTALAGLTRGAELMGNRLVVLVPGRVLEFDLATGHRLYSRPVPNVPSSGVCGIPPCGTPSLRMRDAARGLVAYTLAGKLHLLRMRDGKNRVVRSVTDARFGDTGLFYTYVASGRLPGRIHFVPWAQLPVRP